MQLVIKLNGTPRAEFERKLQSWNWQSWGYFKMATNDKNVFIAQKEEWDYDVRICYMGNNLDYDYFVLFTPLAGQDELFDKRPWLLNDLVQDFVKFINEDYHRNYYDTVTCRIRS